MSKSIDKALKLSVKSGALIFISSAVGLGLWFVSKILIIRNVTPDELGIYSLSIAIVSIVATVARLGIVDTVPRFISISLGKDNEATAADYGRSAFQVVLLSSTLGTILIAAYAAPVAKNIFYMQELTTPLRVMSVFIIFHVLVQVFESIIKCYGKTTPAIVRQVLHPGIFIMMLAYIYLTDKPFISIFIAYVAALFIVVLIIGVYSRSRLNFKLCAFTQSTHKKELLLFSLPLLGSSMLGTIMRWTDTAMIGRYMQASDVAIYSISVTLMSLTPFFMYALSFMFMPIASKMYGKNNINELKRIYQITTKWGFYCTIPLFVVLFFFSEMVIITLFGDYYVAASVPLKLLTSAWMFHIFLGQASSLLVVYGHSNVLFKITVFATVLNVFLNYLFLKHLGLGITGAAMATSISIFFSSTISAIILYKVSKLHIFSLNYIKPIFGAFVSALLVYALAKSIELSLWLLPVYFVMFIIGFILSIFLTRSVEREDLVLLEGILRRSNINTSWLKWLQDRIK